MNGLEDESQGTRTGLNGPFTIGEAYMKLITETIKTSKEIQPKLNDGEISEIFMRAGFQIIVGNGCAYGVEDNKEFLYLTDVKNHPIFNLNPNDFWYALDQIRDKGFHILNRAKGDEIKIKAEKNDGVTKHALSNISFIGPAIDVDYYQSNYTPHGIFRSRNEAEISLEAQVRSEHDNNPMLIKLLSKKRVREIASEHLIAFFGLFSYNIFDSVLDTTAGGKMIGSKRYYIFGECKTEPPPTNLIEIPYSGKSVM